MFGSMDKEYVATLVKQGAAGLFFSLCSIFIVFVNKLVLTTYKFPSFQVLGLGQIAAIIVVIGVGKVVGVVEFPNPSMSQVRKVWPLPLFYILNLVFGLGSTKKLNLPMFTVLRRFALLFTSIAQIYVLNRYETVQVNVTLFMMVGGAFVAALNDLAFDIAGYVYVFINDISTAASVVYSKQKLDTEMTKLELLFYNALISLPFAVLVAFVTGDVKKAYEYEGWTDAFFLVCFLLSSLMGLFLMYSQVLLNQLTSPLTLSVLGCIKNVVITYVGMFVGGDYVFEAKNFIGINISVAASIAYSYFKFRDQHINNQQKQKLAQVLPEAASQSGTDKSVINT